ncbi:hypothetical protein BOX15_Mlig029727g1 [Macrostomum lignano]|uniref:Uncharacterized protein n=2 Tax=Macrostomum lignano TaxID=282301 RepID=A0A1I8IFB0_9PLAT|nr:hypothetical protein BOX15_Mlig029727g1 [Macrostomum lignano]
MKFDDQLPHNETQHLSEAEWEPYEACPRIDKDVLDNQQLDDDVRKLQQEGNSNDASGLLDTFQPEVHINLHYVRVYYCGPQPGSNKTTRVSERPQLMQWRGEHFKCRVGFSFEASMPKSNWTVGLAQACDYINLKNTFERGGSYCWEFQPLKTGLHSMVNDSNGTQWPFYSHKSSMIDLRSGSRIRPGFHELRFSDYFYPTMHWQAESEGFQYHLTNVIRRQGFKVWFIVIKRGPSNPMDGYITRYLQYRPSTDEPYVIKAMEWRYNIELNFDCLQPLGSRCTAIFDKQEEQPRVLNSIDPIPTSALVPPNCNACQSLIFYPTNRNHPLVLKKTPEDIVVPWNEWRSSMTSGRGYDRLLGFEQPQPLPNMYKCYPGDPKIPLRLLNLKHRPREPAPDPDFGVRTSVINRFQ